MGPSYSGSVPATKWANPRALTLLDRLTLVGSSGCGALEFRPDHSVVTRQEYADFEMLVLEVLRILDRDEYRGESIEELQDRGGSSGAHVSRSSPIMYEGKEMLVKFRAKRDSQCISEDEYHYLLFAKECGIAMPETRLFGGKCFIVKRFARAPGDKLRVVSVAGLIGADYRLPGIDYKHIFQVCCVMLTHSVAELWKVYQQMAFNYLIGNGRSR